MLKFFRLVGDTVGLKGRQVRNYMRLTYLIPEILEMVDLGKIQFVPAVDLSYPDEQIQKWVCEYIKDNGFIKPSTIRMILRSVRRYEKKNGQIYHRYSFRGKEQRQRLKNCWTKEKKLFTSL